MDIAMDEIGFAGSVIVMVRPAAWRLVESPRGLLACALDPEEAAFRPNVTVTVDGNVDAALNQRVAALQASLPQVVVIAAEQRARTGGAMATEGLGGLGGAAVGAKIGVRSAPSAARSGWLSAESPVASPARSWAGWLSTR